MLLGPTALVLVCSLTICPPASTLIERLADYRSVVCWTPKGLGDATAWRGVGSLSLVVTQRGAGGRGVEESEGVAESPLEGWGNIPLGGVGGLEQDNVHVDLNGKGENSLLPFVNRGELQNIAVE